jgi:hypothetical protein
MDMVRLPNGWYVELCVDDDKHLNIYVTNSDDSEVKMVRFEEWKCDKVSIELTTKQIEDDYKEEA